MNVALPGSLDQALGHLARDPSLVPVAGATDLLVHWPGHHAAHDRDYLDLSGLDELKAHRWTEEELVIGGLTTYWDLIKDRETTAAFPLLVDAGRQVGAIQIQSRGTWAGNIVNASPAADGVPVLMAYDAVVTLASTDGEEDVPLDDFYLGYKKMRRRPEQLITSIRLPRRLFDYQKFVKVGPRAAQAITKIGVAITHCPERDPDDAWRVVTNSAAPTVKRCRTVEATLIRETPIAGPDDLQEALEQDVAPIDDIRSTAAYRRRVLSRVLYFELREFCPWIT